MDETTLGQIKAGTGIAGLDDILAGGFSRGHVFLLREIQAPGKPPWRFASFCRERSKARSASTSPCRKPSQNSGQALLPMGGRSAEIEIFELVPPESLLAPDQEQTLLYSFDLELGETTRLIFDAFERCKPIRVVLDSLSEIRLLAQSSLRYRRQILTFKHYFSRLGVTVLLLDDLTSELSDKTVHSIVHGVIQIEELAPDYGAERRRLRVSKYRGQAFRGGYHDFAIRTGEVAVFPRLVASEHRTRF